MLRAVCVMMLALSAAACGGGNDTDERAPANKILARSTTDEMLPLEAVQSQAPLAKSAPAGTGKKSADDEKGEGEAAKPTDEIAPPPVIESPPPTDTIGAAISGKSATQER